MNSIKAFFKRQQVWGFFVSLAVMAIVSLAFFAPDNFDGLSLSQPDMQQGAANGQEAKLFHEATGEKALWTDALLGGMPTFQISPSYPSNDLFTWLNTVYGLGLPTPSNLLFMMMLGFLILMYAMGYRWYYGLIGALAWGLSSYFVIIIGAGHIWKFLALTYIPPTIGGLILLYRGRYLAGTAMAAIFAMLQLNANHPQMTYYFGFVMAFLAIAFLVDAIRNKKIAAWSKATGLLVLAGALALGANAPSLYHTYIYSKETKRAQSELVDASESAGNASAERPTGGLPMSDIVGWSYGKSELFSLLIPNIKGGASARPEGGMMVPMTLDKLADAPAGQSASPLLPYLTQYFNDSEGTNGPVYVGAIIFVFFLLGCFIVKGPVKWALLASTIFAALLSLGYNAQWITDLMVYNFPMYSKFRAVESILVIVEFTLPLLAVMAMAQLFQDGKEGLQKNRKALAVSFGLPAAVCLLAMAWPSIFGDAITNTDLGYAEQLQKQVADYASQQGYDQTQLAGIMYHYSLSNPENAEVIESLRYGMLRSDALRSLMFIAFAALFTFMALSGKMRRRYAIAAIGVLICGDMYMVDKRYVSHTSFNPQPMPSGEISFAPDQLDAQILQDKDHYRVLDIPGFGQAKRSYFHKTVGGYHAAKLNRYEDIIQRRLMPMLQMGYFPDAAELNDPEYAEVATQLRNAYAVANMLNARYVITGHPQQPLVRNPNALGAAWLVDSIIWVDGARQEMDALDVRKVDFNHQAVADRKFASALPASVSAKNVGDTISLVSYTPNELTYKTKTGKDAVALFSEVYFPWGWNVSIDGKPATLARANYILRALALPAGEHTVTMTFAPASIATTGTVAYVCIILIYLLLAAAVVYDLRLCRRS